jgi:hypothetical protein
MGNIFNKILEMAEGPERTAAIAQWVQALYTEDDIPVLVGGSAVELYTGGAYTTGDLDFVGHISPVARKAMIEAGFIRHGRNWIHEGAMIFLEFPSSSLGENERIAILNVGRFQIRIVCPEDLLVDRLAAWKHWVSPVDGVNSLLLYRAQSKFFDEEHLEKRAMAEDVQNALEAVRSLHREYPDDLPADEVLEKWSQKIK